MKHRHKLQQQRQKTASPNNAAELEEDEEVLPGKAKPKKHGGSIHAARAKHHLGKRGRIGQRRRFEDGGTASGTRSPNDPGDEIAAANKGRKGTLGRIQDELLGPKSAYARGGRLDTPRGYDAGGAAPPSNAYEGSLLQQFNTTPQLNPVVKFVKQNNPAPSLQAQPRSVPPPRVPTRPSPPRIPGVPSGSKQGGRIYKNRAKEK
jgi:hypothetical protein